MKFEAADYLAQRGIIDFDGVKINMHMLILTQLKIILKHLIEDELLLLLAYREALKLLHIDSILDYIANLCKTIPLTDLICRTGISPFKNFVFNTSIDLFNKTNKVNFQAIAAIVIDEI